MKLPSLRQLAEHSTQTFSRFPFALTSAIVGTGAWIIIIERTATDSPGFMEDLSLVGMLGISLFTGVTLVCEKLNTSWARAQLANLTALLALTAYYITLPEHIFDAPTSNMIRYVLLGAGLHFFVSVGPFFRRGEINGFWQFNKSLFLRFLTAALYSSVLYLGLAAAILAVDQLFDAHISPKRYGELWVFITGIFNTWFFLSGVPRDLHQLETESTYPKGLKIFTQYVLFPLVFLYLIILYAYEIKIVAEWSWPKGWVGYLVLIFSVLGIFSLLLVHPIKDRLENAWIRFTSKYLYVALIPLVLLLLLAIWRRISEYGLTELRYFVVVLDLWLVAMILYFLFSKTKSIKVIPVTLCVIAFASSFGPWGALALSERTQVGRLSEVLTRTGVFHEGKIGKATQTVTFDDQKQVSSIVRYLNDVHGLKAIQPWFDADLDTVGTTLNYRRPGVRYNRPAAVLGILGITYVDEWQSAETKNMSYQSAQQTALDIRGFTHLVRDVTLSQWDSTKTITVSDAEWNLLYHAAPMTIELKGARAGSPDLSFDLNSLISTLEAEYGNVTYASNIPATTMSVEKTGGDVKVKIALRSITVTKSGGTYRVNHLQGDLFIGTPGK